MRRKTGGENETPKGDGKSEMISLVNGIPTKTKTKKNSIGFFDLLIRFYSVCCTVLVIYLTNKQSISGCQEAIKLSTTSSNAQNENTNIASSATHEVNSTGDEHKDSITASTPNEAQPLESPITSLIKKTGGGSKSWKVVDWDNNPITEEEEDKFNCDFVEFESASSGKSAQMCVHSFRDIVSGNIRRKKNWGDCNVLPKLWNDAGNNTDSATSPIYLEIGANIGSCVMEMLLATDAPIIAFEPHPMNLYNLKKTVSRLDKSYQDRLTLFPVGLGDAEATSTIYSANNNMGNSVIGTIIKDGASQQFDEKLQFTIHVERLDSLLSSENLDVKLMKIDAQGFECRVLDGMGEDILRKVDQIKFEYAGRWLQGQNCTDYLPRLRNHGFGIYRGKGGGKMDGEFFRKDSVIDLYAAKPGIV